MAHNELLTRRVREALAGIANVEEKKCSVALVLW